VNASVKGFTHAQNTAMPAENISGFFKPVLVYHPHLTPELIQNTNTF
jgi:hypothetical protein